jgi:hypothetical protein
MHPITCTSGHLPDNFIWWHFRTVGWLGYVKVALLVKHVNVVLPQSSCWCSSIVNWGLINRGKKFLYVASVVITYSLNCLRCESPYRACNSLWRLHLQLICSLSLFLSCLFLFQQPCKLMSISLMYFGFRLQFQKICFWVKFQISQQVEFFEELISHCMYSIPNILDQLRPTCCGYNRERSMKFVLLPTYQCDKLCLPCCGYNRERSMKFVLLPTYQ